MEIESVNMMYVEFIERDRWMPIEVFRHLGVLLLLLGHPDPDPALLAIWGAPSYTATEPLLRQGVASSTALLDWHLSRFGWRDPLTSHARWRHSDLSKQVDMASIRGLRARGAHGWRYRRSQFLCCPQ